MTHFWLTIFAVYCAYALLDAFWPFWERGRLVAHLLHLKPQHATRNAVSSVASVATARIIQNFQACDAGCPCNDCQISRGSIQQVQRQRRESFS